MKIGYARRCREPRYPALSRSDEMQAPNSISERLVALVREPDHHIHRVDRVRALVGPIGPVVFLVGPKEPVYFKTICNLRPLCGKACGGERQEDTQISHSKVPELKDIRSSMPCWNESCQTDLN